MGTLGVAEADMLEVTEVLPLPPQLSFGALSHNPELPVFSNSKTSIHTPQRLLDKLRVTLRSQTRHHMMYAPDCRTHFGFVLSDRRWGLCF